MSDKHPDPGSRAADGLRLTADRPKQHLTEDRLGYADFARTIARSIADLDTTDGMVLAVNGPWGSGKTTAVYMIEEALSEAQKDTDPGQRILPVRFNPWWFSEQEDLVKAFFAELSTTIGETISEKVGRGFSMAARHIALSRGIVVAGLGLMPGGGAVAKLAEAAIDSVGSLAAPEKSLSQIRDQIVADLRGQNKRLLVIIDDIDRLPANEVRQIFRLVKSVANLPNVVYLLVFDRSLVEHIFEDCAPDLGPKWHDKIIQAGFDLPPIQPIDLQRLFIEGVHKLVGDMEVPNEIRWWNVYHDCVAPWLNVPRDVGRLLNALAVSWRPVARNVDFSDFVSIETLRLFEPDLYTFIRHNRGLLTGIERDHASDRDSKEKLSKRILDTVEPDNHVRTKGSLQRLFPRLELVWGNHGYRSEFLREWDQERRICIERHFPAYFRFVVGSDVLVREELEEFTRNISDREFVLAKISEYKDEVRVSGATKAIVLLDELDGNIKLIADKDTDQAIFNILDSADLFLKNTDEDRSGAFDFPLIWRIARVVSLLLQRRDLSSLTDLLPTVFATASSLQALSFVLMMFRSSLGRDPDSVSKPGAAGPPLIDDALCEKLEVALRARFKAAAADETLINADGLIMILHQWRSLGGEAEVRDWTRRMIDDDAAVVQIAKSATHVQRSFALGDRVMKQSPSVNLDGLEKIMDVNRLAARLTEVANSEPGPEVSTVIRNFMEGVRAALPSISDGHDQG